VVFIRKVKTKSGAIATQIVNKLKGKLKIIKHLGSAQSKNDLKALITLAKTKLQENQPSLFPSSKTKLEIKLRQSVSILLYQVLFKSYQKLGFNKLNNSLFAFVFLFCFTTTKYAFSHMFYCFDRV